MQQLAAKYKKVIILVGLLILGIILVCVLKLAYTPRVYEKVQFTEEDQYKIFDTFNVENDGAVLDKFRYTHGKESAFVAYVSNVDIEELRLCYRISWDEKAHVDGNGERFASYDEEDCWVEITECEDGTYNAMFILYRYDRELLDIVK